MSRIFQRGSRKKFWSQDSFRQNYSVSLNYPPPNCSLNSSLVNRDGGASVEHSESNTRTAWYMWFMSSLLGVKVDWELNWELVTLEIQRGKEVTTLARNYWWEVLNSGTGLYSQKLSEDRIWSVSVYLSWLCTSKNQCEVSLSPVQW